MTDTNHQKNTEPAVEWRVQVFRHTQTAGWERLQVGVAASSAVDDDATKHHHHNNKKAPRRHVVRARPLEGSIVMRRLRLRVLLKKSRSVVTRRDSCLRIQSQHGGARVLVLRFVSVRECLAFGDALMRLNPLPSTTILEEESSLAKRLSSSSCTAVDHHDRESSLFWLVRLIYDPENQALVRSVENTLLASTEGQRVLDDLVKLMPLMNDEDDNDEQEDEEDGDEQQKQPAKPDTV